CIRPDRPSRSRSARSFRRTAPRLRTRSRGRSTRRLPDGCSRRVVCRRHTSPAREAHSGAPAASTSTGAQTGGSGWRGMPSRASPAPWTSEEVVKLGIVLPQGLTGEYAGWGQDAAVRRTLEIARQAEDLGFESVWVYDHLGTFGELRDEPTPEAFALL